MRRDSILHAETCALIVLVLSAFLPLWLSATIALLAGIGKELWDKEHGGVPSWTDVLCDLAGVAAGVLIAML